MPRPIVFPYFCSVERADYVNSYAAVQMLLADFFRRYQLNRDHYDVAYGFSRARRWAEVTPKPEFTGMTRVP